jgi:hypothetical protein
MSKIPYTKKGWWKSSRTCLASMRLRVQIPVPTKILSKYWEMKKTQPKSNQFPLRKLKTMHEPGRVVHNCNP